VCVCVFVSNELEGAEGIAGVVRVCVTESRYVCIEPRRGLSFASDVEGIVAIVCGGYQRPTVCQYE